MFNVKDLESFVVKASSALQLKFVRNEADILDERLTFVPNYTHQVFGEKETIFGLKDLKIQLYYTPDTLSTYIGLTYSNQSVSPKPDNVVKILSEYIPQGYCTNLDEYLKRLSGPSKFKPFGELIHVYTCNNKRYEIYKTDISSPGFQEYHERLQTFLLWFVDASSFIDIDDDKWTFYLTFEKDSQDGSVFYAIVGYATVYSFYTYPDKIRPRISQLLILPPFQRQGHGVQLLQSVYDTLTPDPKVLDITVEEPSDEFTKLRDFVDCRNALQMDCFRPPDIHAEFQKEAGALCQQKLKLYKKQARRVYEILRLKATDRSNQEAYKTYRLMVKNRLNGPHQREQNDLKRLQQFVDPVELALTHPQLSRDEHMANLQTSYKELETEYLNVIEKLAAVPI